MELFSTPIAEEYDWKENPPFLLWMAMNRLDMIVPMGWKLSAYWRNRSGDGC